MKNILLILLLFISHTVKSQDCNCYDALGEIIDYTEENYSLISFKLNDSNRHIYQAHKETVLHQAQGVEEKNCKPILDTYLAFFNDFGHLEVTSYNYKNPISQEVKKYEEVTSLDSVKIMKLLDNKNLDPIEGIWETSGYTIGIVKNQNKKRKRDFSGIVLSTSNPNFTLGEIKMEITKVKDAYKSNYLMGNKNVKILSTQIIENFNIVQEDIVVWKKIYPMPEGAIAKEIGDLDPRGVVFKDLGNKNYYLKIGSFGGMNAQIVEDIVESNKEKLQESNLLIVDVRDNSGGSDYTYSPLLPYIYTGPVRYAKFGAWVSPGNKEYFSGWLEKSDTTNNTQLFQAMQSNIPQIVTWPDEEMTEELDSLFTNPSKVAILANEESASSAETFILRCRQSEKVVTFGQNTSGTVDGFNGKDYETDCFTLRHPTSLRTIYYDTEAVDPFGILPDVYFSEQMEDPIQYIINYMNNFQLQRDKNGGTDGK